MLSMRIDGVNLMPDNLFGPPGDGGVAAVRAAGLAGGRCSLSDPAVPPSPANRLAAGRGTRGTRRRRARGAFPAGQDAAKSQSPLAAFGRKGAPGTT